MRGYWFRLAFKCRLSEVHGNMVHLGTNLSDVSGQGTKALHDFLKDLIVLSKWGPLAEEGLVVRGCVCWVHDTPVVLLQGMSEPKCRTQTWQ